METVTQQQASAFDEIDEIDRACLQAAYAGLSTKEMVRNGIGRSEHTINNRLSTVARKVGAVGRFQAAKLYVAFLNQQEVTENLPNVRQPIARDSVIEPLSTRETPTSAPPVLEAANSDADPEGPNSHSDRSAQGRVGAVGFERWWAAMVHLGGLERDPLGIHPSSRARVHGERGSRAHHTNERRETELFAAGRPDDTRDSSSRAGLGVSLGEGRGGSNALIYVQRIRAVFLLAAVVGAFGAGIIIMMVGLITFAAQFLAKLHH